MRIGLLGGSFNPIHNGHLAMAQAALSVLTLDRVLFLPAACPPHKRSGLLPYDLRMQLVGAALALYPNFSVSDLDGRTDPPNYTYFLIDRVRDTYPGCEPFFLIGEDNLLQLPSWYRWRELLDKVTIAVFTRIGRQQGECPFSSRVLRIPMKPVRVSSTTVRRRLRTGQSVDHLVPPPVAEYLAAHPGLFQ
jgi:nicotinate-nucleotide adenylyltransferase